MRILLLPINPDDLLQDQDIQLIGVTAGFLCQGLEGRGGKGAFAGEKQIPVVEDKEVVKFGRSDAQVQFAFGGEGNSPTWKRVSCLA